MQTQIYCIKKAINCNYYIWNNSIDSISSLIYRRLILTISQKLLQQTNSTDCNIYLLKNAQYISQKVSVNRKSIIANNLRIIFVKLLIERLFFETSEQSLLKNVLFYIFSDLCRIENKLQLCIFRTISKYRKLKLENIEVQRENSNKIKTSFSNKKISRFYIEIKTAELFIIWLFSF